MRTGVTVEELGAAGPRVLLLPGIGTRASGFRALARALAAEARPVLVDYPERHLAGLGAGALATQVLEAAGPADAAVGSSFGGMVAAHLAARGQLRGLALVGSFTHPDQLGLRGRTIFLMGAVALLGRPGRVAACVAANALVPSMNVPDIVPTTPDDRWSVVFRSLAARAEPAPDLRGSRVSCVCLHGERDLLVPVGVLPRVLASLPPGTPAHLLPGAGHVPYFTHVSECARVLAPWLRALTEEDRPVAA